VNISQPKLMSEKFDDDDDDDYNNNNNNNSVVLNCLEYYILLYYHIIFMLKFNVLIFERRVMLLLDFVEFNWTSSYL